MPTGTRTLDIDDTKMTGFGLKTLIAGYFGLPVHAQRLVFNGKAIDNSFRLLVVGVTQGSTVSVLVRHFHVHIDRKSLTSSSDVKIVVAALNHPDPTIVLEAMNVILEQCGKPLSLAVRQNYSHAQAIPALVAAMRIHFSIDKQNVDLFTRAFEILHMLLVQVVDGDAYLVLQWVQMV